RYWRVQASDQAGPCGAFREPRHTRRVQGGGTGPRGRRRNTRRQTHHTASAPPIPTASTSASASHGQASASPSAPTTTTSSELDAARLLTGSGEVLSMARDPALSTWLASATPAPVASIPA